MKETTYSGRTHPVPIDDDGDGPRLWLSTAVLADTSRLLRSYGDTDHHEGIVYLGGKETVDGAVALVALSPSATTSWGSFETDQEANTQVVVELARLGLVIVGQVHSHPGDWVDHSDGDDAGAIVRFEGFWSIVVPSFADQGMSPISRCGVHVFREGQFRRLSLPALAHRVHVIPPAVDLRKADA